MTSASDDPSRAVPRVALVGAGPGGADLLTLRAADRIRRADILLVDRLVDPDVLSLARPGARIMSVGKSKGDHPVPQEEICRRLVEAARTGAFVVRLKGGDPFIFGRGGEEMEALAAAGIPFEIVPGVTSALAAAAAARAPLTHRGVAQSVVFVTGHAALGGEPDLDWASLARPNQTVVVFMGVGAAPVLVHRLIGAGRSPATPVAVVENASRPQERILRTTLDGMADLLAAENVAGPAILIIGEAVDAGPHAPACAARRAEAVS